jgi:hypothetical protein
MADLALLHPTRVCTQDGFQAVRAAVLFDERQLDMRPM